MNINGMNLPDQMGRGLGISNAMLGVMQNAGPDPMGIHMAAHDKAMQQAGYAQNPGGGWMQTGQQSQQSAPGAVPQQVAPSAVSQSQQQPNPLAPQMFVNALRGFNR